jgi:NAD(P)-dependent dehydrogenase (short-subunit alcohol dehydrogenase family)
VKSIDPNIEMLVVPTDISSPDAVKSLFDKVKAAFPDDHASILINNAALVSGGPTIHENTPDEFWRNFEVNLRGPFLLSRAFISQLPDPQKSPATIATLTTFSAYQVFPFMAGYAISKLGAWSLAANIAEAYKNITCAIVHPGLVKTRQLLDAFARFDLDPPELVGSVLVWIASDPERSRFLSGRMISANWDVEGLLERRVEILNSNMLKLDLVGPFGKEQFEKQS